MFVGAVLAGLVGAGSAQADRSDDLEYLRVMNGLGLTSTLAGAWDTGQGVLVTFRPLRG